MYKFWFFGFLLITIVLLIFHNYSINNEHSRFITMEHQLDSVIFEDKITPIVNWIEQNPTFEHYNIDWSLRANGVNDQNIEVLKKLFDKSWVKDLSNNNNTTKLVLIKYINNINPSAYDCVYLYWKNSFKNRWIIWKPSTDSKLFELFGSKMASNKLYKINDDYAKYCTFPLFY